MIIRSAEFEISAVRPNQWPEGGLPEFAFIGRSNVGKSTLLNRLLGRKNLARTSGQPGKTRQINFFAINKLFRFVDLPGYGYAAVSKTQRAQFAEMIDKYLTEREPLVRIVQLVDIRHEPSKDDISVHEGLRGLDVPLMVIATKMDKISKSKVDSHVKVIRKALQTDVQIYPVSAENRVGLDVIWERFENDMAPYLPAVDEQS
ncbi:ribosome biogenesis GTP-binding protein YihA/YsxC [Alicyclobacillus dauci]|uniref:Probable GTP-binding protein EngB n=1 Tax=Alicyclobacillus dauci TaxID=1475485 RepID=A0ABY6Z9K9_9BACL|nr:ribosome biogenesis GTP-binding protein YihA/YsxC [Alicyclobacillus dauci]WAH38946.1 ribosome biogenesis GTP-binding protein YihA/YsxC [Alicyclobacillus dauci]